MYILYKCSLVINVMVPDLPFLYTLLLRASMLARSNINCDCLPVVNSYHLAFQFWAWLVMDNNLVPSAICVSRQCARVYLIACFLCQNGRGSEILNPYSYRVIHRNFKVIHKKFRRESMSIRLSAVFVILKLPLQKSNGQVQDQLVLPNSNRRQRNLK